MVQITYGVSVRSRGCFQGRLAFPCSRYTLIFYRMRLAPHACQPLASRLPQAVG